MSRPVLQIITASTRSGRKGPAVAGWVRRLAEERGAFAVELIDLAEVGLPLLVEPNHPRLLQYTLVEAVAIPFFAQFVNDEGVFLPNAELEARGQDDARRAHPAHLGATAPAHRCLSSWRIPAWAEDDAVTDPSMSIVPGTPVRLG